MDLTPAIAKRLLHTILPVQTCELHILDKAGTVLASSVPSVIGEIRNQFSSTCRLLWYDDQIIGAIELVGSDGTNLLLVKTVDTLARLVLENEALNHSRLSSAAQYFGEPLAVLVGTHPLDNKPLIAELQALGFDLDVPHTTLYIQLSKVETIEVDAGPRELIIDDRQVHYAASNFLNFLASYFSGSQTFLLPDLTQKSVLVLYAGPQEADDMNTLRLYHICDYLQKTAATRFCLTMRAAIGNRCVKLRDYERQYELLRKRFNSGIMLFPEKNIYWGHSILMGSLIFHLSRDNRVRLSSILDKILTSNQSHELMKTLYTFFECDMSHNRAAEKLFIHRNSLQHRLKRIETLTCTKLSNIDDLLSLRLAILCHSSLLIEDQKGD